MKRDDLVAKLKRLSKATKNRPSADDIDLLVESILDNQLIDAEIDRAYAHFRDLAEPWWPKPGEFLKAARPEASKAVVADEGSTLFDLIRDNSGQAYGRYSPEVGTVRDRRLIEKHHGTAAGIAFAAAGGSAGFSTMDERSETFRRKSFCEAYADARRDHGAPLTLDPSRILPAPTQAPTLKGAVAEDAQDGDGRRAFRALMDELRQRTGVGA